jgi:hypothetical protein
VTLKEGPGPERDSFRARYFSRALNLPPLTIPSRVLAPMTLKSRRALRELMETLTPVAELEELKRQVADMKNVIRTAVTILRNEMLLDNRRWPAS